MIKMWLLGTIGILLLIGGFARLFWPGHVVQQVQNRRLLRIFGFVYVAAGLMVLWFAR